MSVCRRLDYPRNSTLEHGLLRKIAIFMSAGLILLPLSARAEYIAYHRYAIDGGATLNVLDFGYTTKTACNMGIRSFTASLTKDCPNCSRASAACKKQVEPDLEKMRGNPRLPMPYFSFQDMRQWVTGVDKATARKICKSAEERYAEVSAQARCLE